MPILMNSAIFGFQDATFSWDCSFWPIQMVLVDTPIFGDTAIIGRQGHFHVGISTFLQNMSVLANTAVFANFSCNCLFQLTLLSLVNTACFSHYRHNQFWFWMGMICKKQENWSNRPHSVIFDRHGTCLCGDWLKRSEPYILWLFSFSIDSFLTLSFRVNWYCFAWLLHIILFLMRVILFLKSCLERIIYSSLEGVNDWRVNNFL